MLMRACSLLCGSAASLNKTTNSRNPRCCGCHVVIAGKVNMEGRSKNKGVPKGYL